MCFQPVKISSPLVEFDDSYSNIFVVVTTRADLNNSFVSTLRGVSRHVLKCAKYENIQSEPVTIGNPEKKIILRCQCTTKTATR